MKNRKHPFVKSFWYRFVFRPLNSVVSVPRRGKQHQITPNIYLSVWNMCGLAICICESLFGLFIATCFSHLHYVQDPSRTMCRKIMWELFIVIVIVHSNIHAIVTFRIFFVLCFYFKTFRSKLYL